MKFTFIPSLLGLLALQSLLQTLLYYAGVPLNAWTDVLTLAGAMGGYGIGSWIMDHGSYKNLSYDQRSTSNDQRSTIHDAPLLLAALASTAFLLWHAHKAATLEPILTPWSRLPHGTLLAIVILALSVWSAAWRKRSFLAGTLSAVFLMTLASLTSWIYPLGFGFDGFLHRASERVLLLTGTLHPKPLYYLGQYVFVTWLTRLTHFPLRWIDLMLLPAALAMLPVCLWLSQPRAQRSTWVFPALLFFFPLAPFITTTPQSFAYVLGLCALLLALASEDGSVEPWIALALAGWSLVTHPLAGLPFFGTTMLVLWNSERGARNAERQRRPLGSPFAWVIILGTLVSVPLAFFVNSLRSGAPILWHWNGLGDLGALWSWRTHVALWADWAATVDKLWPLLLGAAALVTAVRTRRTRPSLGLITLMGGGLLLTGWILNFTSDFTFLISYERHAYADRLLVVGMCLWMIPAVIGLAAWLPRLLARPLLPRLTLLACVAGWQAAQAYNAFPHHDAAHAEHGWSVGPSDFEAVRWMDQDAHGQTYTVLANQSVSAAAIASFGFKRYAGGDIFYYPLPTGGPLYRVYLEAVGDHPTRQAMEQAGRLGQSSRVYVVLNDYWWNAQRVGETLETLSDLTVSLAGGKIRIYRFDLTSDNKR